jgi:hypothetical protein
MNKWQQQTAGAVIDTNARHRDLYNKSITAAADNNIELQRRTAVTSTNPKVRQQAIDEVNGQFDRLFQAGIIKSPEELTLRKRKFADDYSFDRFQMLTPQERYEASQPVKVGDRSKTAYGFFVGKKWTPAQAAGIVGNLIVESRGLDTTAVNRGDARDGTDSVGISQWNQERLTGLKAFAAQNKSDWRDLNIQLGYVQRELETSESSAAQRLRGAQTPREAAAAFAEYFLRPAGSGKGNPEGISHFSKRARAAEAVASQFGGMKIEPTEGDRLYSMLPPERQMQVRDASERDVAQLDRITAQEYSRDIAVANAERSARNNELEVGIYDGRYGIEEVMHRRAIGDVVDADHIKKIDGMLRQQEERIERRSLSDGIVTGTVAYNPTDEAHRKALDERVEFVARTTGRPQEDVAAEVYNVTGMMPKAGVTALRGMSLRNTSEDIIKAGQMAASAMFKVSDRFPNGNPRVFDSFDGGKELAELGTMWAHFRGLMGDDDGSEAAKAIMELRAPGYKSGVNFDQKEETEFKKNIKENAIKDFSDAKLFGSGNFYDNKLLPDGMKNAMLEDYASETMRLYKKYGNESLARGMAMNNLKTVYGVSNGYIQKFPVEKALADMSINGTHDWAYKAAADRVAAATSGRDKPDPKDVFFTEIPMETSDGFRTKSPNTFYRVMYMKNVDGMRVPEQLNAPFAPGQHFSKAHGEWQSERDAKIERDRNLARLDANAVAPPMSQPSQPGGDVLPPVTPEGRVDQVQGNVRALQDTGQGGIPKAVGDWVKSTPANPLKGFVKSNSRNRLPGGNK